ncbi:hypothetical protein [Streptomyces sp. NPDC001880]
MSTLRDPRPGPRSRAVRHDALRTAGACPADRVGVALYVDFAARDGDWAAYRAGWN